MLCCLSFSNKLQRKHFHVYFSAMQPLSQESLKPMWMWSLCLVKQVYLFSWDIPWLTEVTSLAMLTLVGCRPSHLCDPLQYNCSFSVRLGLMLAANQAAECALLYTSHLNKWTFVPMTFQLVKHGQQNMFMLWLLTLNVFLGGNYHFRLNIQVDTRKII